MTDTIARPAREPDDVERVAAPWPERLAGWFTPALPRNRLAVLRVVAYVFATYYVFHMQQLPRVHAHLAGSLYRPLRVAQILPFVPRPTPLVIAVCQWTLLAAVVVGLAGRLPRVTGVIVACCYFQWVVMASSYGKVDHDQLGFLLLLFALPTAGALSLRDATADPRAGWVLRLAQIGAVATYFL
ncbi:MAG: transporter permease, partial [Acidimicrobiales bacterium]|nr:transporter permease [Acidimicrobiales bacterium]